MDEWAVKKEWMEPVLQCFQVWPTIDLFATADNTRCGKFFSKGPQPGTRGVDFFAQQLKAGEVYHCCLPVKLAAHCIKKLLLSRNWSSGANSTILDQRCVLATVACRAGIHLGSAGLVYVDAGVRGHSRGRVHIWEESRFKLRVGLIHTGEIATRKKY